MFYLAILSIPVILHLWGKSTFAGAWVGVLVMLLGFWLIIGNPAIIPAGETVTYTYDANGFITQEVHTITYSPTPDIFPGWSIAQFLGLALIPIGVYMAWWNALSPRK